MSLWYYQFAALNQFRRNPFKNQFKKRKNLSKRCSNSILKFFQRDFKNGTYECGIKAVRDKRIRNYFLNFKLKFGIFNSMAVTLYLSSTCNPIFRSFAIFNSTFFESLRIDFVAKTKIDHNASFCYKRKAKKR